ncbi:phage major capsid protein [Amycolatopsis sp. WQ 127309]|uniref:phage major capsid protein n=1 Tax=Amycolatopsis sp. WQ 127309 TaxID=2932773 RepID=UPI001FF20C0B|nr:phage major capsid protein [Amycolatopsis sp. WQ 127309]UOZ10537.1 phage major capsid protein [Amycolatopsis sp. WQ 127309]
MTVAIPTSPSELEELLADPKKTGEIFAAMQNGDSKPFQDLIRNYAGNVAKKDPEIGAQVREQVQLVMAEFMEKNDQSKKGVKLDFSATGDPVVRYAKLHNKKAVGAPLDGLFPDVTAYLQAVWNKAHNSAETVGKLEQIRAYQEKVPSEGGFLVPEEFRSELLRMSLTTSVVRPRARVIPMASATLRFPKIDETSRVSSVFGGVVVYRTEEGAELAESAATFGSIKLEATKQTALAHVTNELVRDWGAFGVFINEIFPEALAWYEDLDFLSANGVGAPLGALNSGNQAIISVAAEAGQATASIVWENILRMYCRMLPSSIARAVWVASPDVFVELATMALAVGTGGSAVWLTNGQDAPVLTLLGRPVIMDEKAPAALGTQGDLSFVDFGMYLIGDRQQMTVDSSEHVKFTSDKTTYRMIQRNDGRPWLESPITPHNNSATLSPFVQLATRP